jgi:hypothetical protein
MLHLRQAPRLDHSNYTWRRVQIAKLLDRSGYLQDNFLGTNDEPPQHYRPSNRTLHYNVRQPVRYIILQYITLYYMDPKSVKMSIRCGMCNINAKNTKHMYSITEVHTHENPRIHRGHTQGYLKIYDLFSRQQVIINRVQ